MRKQTKNKTWRKMKLGDVAVLNPSVRLEKGEKYPFVSMEQVEIGRKYIYPSEMKEYKGGGVKFNDGDVLFARITPSLEHGKVGVAKLLKKEKIGFGSTEFFVFRGKENVTYTDYLYYLSKTHELRQIAINSMVGVSGRQRARIEAIANYKFNLPPFNEQKRVASILSAFDEKIELNNKINKILEEMAQAIFKRWFVEFKFPGWEKVKFVDSELGKIPEGWEVKNIMEIIKRLPVGKRYDNRTALPKGKVPILDQGQSGIIGFHNEEPSVKASPQNPVAVFSNHTCYYRLITYDFSCIQNVIPYIGINGYPTLFVYYLTKNKVKMSDYKGHWPEFTAQKFVIPPKELAIEFANKIQPFIEMVDKIQKENQALSALRDLLLPKLMSGEIEV